MNNPLRVAVIGMGGFAQAHQLACIRLEEEGILRLTATCDPRLDLFRDNMRNLRFAERGVKIFTDLNEILEHESSRLDFVILPTPVPLHAPMHRACREHGLAVYLEKPPTLDIAELDEMISTDTRDARATNVGFNFLRHPERLALKHRLLRGEFGTLRHVAVRAIWGRPESYFLRNGWAGRMLTPAGRDLLDSCFSNAMSHLVLNALHWSGLSDISSLASPTLLHARRWKVHDIETFDTVFAECATREGPGLSFALSHASTRGQSQSETLHCDRAVLRFDIDHSASIEWNTGAKEHISLTPFDPVVHNLRHYANYLAGRSQRPVITLAESRPFVELNKALYHFPCEDLRNAAQRVTQGDPPETFRILPELHNTLETLQSAAFAAIS